MFMLKKNEIKQPDINGLLELKNKVSNPPMIAQYLEVKGGIKNIFCFIEWVISMIIFYDGKLLFLTVL